MRSHSYQFNAGEVIPALTAPVFGLACLAGLLLVLNWLDLLPPQRRVDDPDQTLLACKSELSRSQFPAKVVLVGDSSCATGLDAPELRSLLPEMPATLNLGLILGMGLQIYGEVLSDFLDHNPGQVQLVILLVTPQLLTNESLSPPLQRLWEELRESARSPKSSPQRLDSLADILAIPLMKERVLSRLIRVPFRGRGAEFYGFSADLHTYLVTHDGSMCDPGLFQPPRHPIPARYYLSPALEAQSKDFRGRLPAGTKLALGLTPLPQSLSPAGYRERRDHLLGQWNEWMKADFLLTNLTAALPDGLFATGAHLNPRGQEWFTRQLAAALTQQSVVRGASAK